jgi:hypothetical protein
VNFPEAENSHKQSDYCETTVRAAPVSHPNYVGLFLTQQLPPSPTRRTGHRLAVALTVFAGLAMLVWAIVAASR